MGHHLTVYKHPESKSIVFAAGSIIFSWGLDAHHDSATGIPPHDENYYAVRVLKDGYGPMKEIQQAMGNLFADMDCTKAATMDEGFVFEKYNESALAGTPLSWVDNPKKTKKKKETYEAVPNDKEKRLRCIRIEGQSRTGFGESIIAGMEVSISNQYVGGKNWRDETRWFAAMIDYEQIETEYRKKKKTNERVREWPWYFEAWIDLEMKGQLHVQSRAVTDNGDIEDVSMESAAKLKLNSLRPCRQKDWIWRKRPILSKYEKREGSDITVMKTEL